MRRLHWSVYLLSGVILLGVLIKFFFGREPSGEVVAMNAIDCTLKYDAGCIYGMLDRDEIGKAGVTEEKLRRFLVEYVRPKLQGFKRSGPMEKEGAGTTLTQRLEGPNGRPVKLSLTVSASDAGSTISPYVVSVVFALFACTRDRPLAGLDTIAYWKQCVTEEAPKLKALGIDGFLRVTPKGTDYITWEMYGTHLAGVLEKEAQGL